MHDILCGIDDFFGNIINRRCYLKFIKNESGIIQHDSYNCGAFWCLFIYDTIMNQSIYLKQDNTDAFNKHTIVYREFIKNNINEAIEIFRYEHIYVIKILILLQQQYDFDEYYTNLMKDKKHRLLLDQYGSFKIDHSITKKRFKLLSKNNKKALMYRNKYISAIEDHTKGFVIAESEDCKILNNLNKKFDTNVDDLIIKVGLKIYESRTQNNVLLNLFLLCNHHVEEENNTNVRESTCLPLLPPLESSLSSNNTNIEEGENDKNVKESNDINVEEEINDTNVKKSTEDKNEIINTKEIKSGISLKFNNKSNLKIKSIVIKIIEIAEKENENDKVIIARILKLGIR